MLDLLIGSHETQVAESDHDELEPIATRVIEEFSSPFRAYYFNSQKLEDSPEEYLTLLSNLVALRRHLREYRPDKQLLLKDFVDFVDLHKKTKTPLIDTADHHENTQAINLMTAHKSKGLEFDTVFVVSCQESIWGGSARTRSSAVRFPHNLPIDQAAKTDDDHLRLFFVAMTRARHQLFMTNYLHDDTGKTSMPISFIDHDHAKPIVHDEVLSPHTQALALEAAWQSIQAPCLADQKTLLAPRLEKYQLNATHLNNFIDVTGGGPQAFLLQNLLRFPQAMHRSAIFGTIIHKVLQRAHNHLASTKERRPIEDILQDFETQMQSARLSDIDYNFLLEKGSTALQTFMSQRYDSFSPEQKAEYSLHSVKLDQAVLTGTIDLLKVDSASKTIVVTDYKTGKAPTSWQGSTDYEKIKLHKYRQQLMMYKLLIENSSEFSSYKMTRGILEFVEPSDDNKIKCLEMSFDKDELENFKTLVNGVWQKIISFDLPDISKYSADYRGILEFEADLRD